jgi:hypothetical protein
MDRGWPLKFPEFILKALFGLIVRLMEFGVKELKDRKSQDSRKARNVNM